MIESISKVDVYMGLAISGLFSGLGAALGSYFANKHVIERGRRIVKRIKRTFRNFNF